MASVGRATLTIGAGFAGLLLVWASACSTSGGDTSTPALAAVSQTDGSFGSLMVSKDGEILTPVVDRDGTGSITRITGVVYTSRQGASVTVYLGADGRPAQAVMGGYVLVFSGWNASAGTVDIAKVFTPTGRIDILRGVPSQAAKDPTGGVSIQSIGSMGGDGLHALALCFPACDTTQKNLAEGLKLAAFAFTTGACVAGSASSLGAMVVPCTGALIEGATMLVGDESWLGQREGAGRMLSGIGCSHGDAVECIALAMNLASTVLAASDATRNDNAPLLSMANVFLSDPKQGSGTAKDGATPACSAFECNPNAYMPCYPNGTKQCSSACTWGACGSTPSGGCAQVPDCATGTHQEGCSCVPDADASGGACTSVPGLDFQPAVCPTGTTICCSQGQVCCNAHGETNRCEFPEYCD